MVANVAKLFQGLNDTYSVQDIEKDFPVDSPLSQQDRWCLYCSIATLLHRKQLSSATEAERRFKHQYQLSRQRLTRIHAMLIAEQQLPESCPMEFQAGRRRAAIASPLSQTEREDLLRYVKFHDTCASNLCVEDMKHTIARMQLAKDNLVPRDEEELLLQLPEYQSLYNCDRSWRTFKEWVASTQPHEDQLCVARLMNHQASCTGASDAEKRCQGAGGHFSHC